MYIEGHAVQEPMATAGRQGMPARDEHRARSDDFIK